MLTYKKSFFLQYMQYKWNHGMQKKFRKMIKFYVENIFPLKIWRQKKNLMKIHFNHFNDVDLISRLNTLIRQSKTFIVFLIHTNIASIVRIWIKAKNHKKMPFNVNFDDQKLNKSDVDTKNKYTNTWVYDVF